MDSDNLIFEPLWSIFIITNFLALMDSKELQELFINYFESNNHTIVQSSSVVPYNDNTLLFVNSGMVQFKKLFSMSSSDLPYTTATSSQHCIRAGGKHNDLDDVGKDGYHHTFFFMLGNWSFGNYFKEKAIFYAYDFLINVLKLDKNRIYVSYYKNKENVDTETYEIWKKHVPESRILPFDEKDNFWEMGDTGPCGPCTEIHYDCRDGLEDASHLVNMDHPDVIEIWNIVFIQYYRNQDKSLSSLSMKCIDTGMGMERVLRIKNKSGSNYMTDSFMQIIAEIEKHIEKNEIKDKKGNNENENKICTEMERLEIKEVENGWVKDKKEKITEDNGNVLENNKCNMNLHQFNIYKDTYDTLDPSYKKSMAMRVIADHSRTISVCLNYGVAFSADGRGYVLRRIMRRAIKYCNELKLTNKMSIFVKVAADSIGIKIDDEKLKMVDNEEKLFLKTLEKGKKILLKQKNKLSGKDAFMLFDTFGFPFDLTEIYCKENNIDIDKEEFERLKNEMRERSRKKDVKKAGLSFDVLDNLRNYKVTDDCYKYTQDELRAKLLCVCSDDAILCENIAEKILAGEKTNVKRIDNIDEEIFVYLLFDKTCFYSESGGQVGDTGNVEFKGFDLRILDTQKYNNYVLHKCKAKGNIFEGLNVFEAVLSINKIRREKIMNNHTSTHLLNHALRLCFKGVEQKGSLVDEKKLRFDFTHNAGLSVDNLKTIEKIVNEAIQKEIPVVANEVSISEIGTNVVFLKEEKYPDKVRVIDVINTCAELCGGTHVDNTKRITRFRIVSECGISNNIRRIVAYTSEEALNLEKNLLQENALDLELPLIEKLLLLEQLKIKEKEKFKIQKQMVKDNIKRLNHEYEYGNNARYKCTAEEFVFECDFECGDPRTNLKNLNSLANSMKNKIKGIAYYVINDKIFFTVRGEDSKKRGRQFSEQFLNVVLKGDGDVSNGSGSIKS